MARVDFTFQELKTLELEFSMATESSEDFPADDQDIIDRIMEKLQSALLRAKGNN
jgi:hypothetical protein